MKRENLIFSIALAICFAMILLTNV